MKHLFILIGVSLMLALAPFYRAAAQGSAGQVIFVDDFGTGAFPTGQALPSGVTNFTFAEPAQPANFDAAQPNNGVVNDGFYTIANNTKQAFSSWADITDNTAGDVDGLMLVFNARENELVDGEVVEDEFFRKTVTLTANAKFDFLASLVPTNSVADEEFCRTNFGALVLPNIRFSIQAPDGTVLTEFVTGEIPFSATPKFEEYRLAFTTSPSVRDVQIVLSSIAPGGCGNDIAIDDIIFRVAVTAAATDDAVTVVDAAVTNPQILNVAANDKLDGALFPAPNVSGSTTTIALLSDASFPPELTFDLATGNVGIIGGAPNGVFSFDYQICETDGKINCDVATVSVTVEAPSSGLGGGSCPAGQMLQAQTGFALKGYLDGAAAPNVVGKIEEDGTVDLGSSTTATFFPPIDLDFTESSTQLIAENSTITLSVARFFGNSGLTMVQSSIDGVSFNDIGTIGFGGVEGTLATLDEENTLRRVDITVPEDGIRIIRLDHLSGGYRVDGAQRNAICSRPLAEPQLRGEKTVTMLDDGLFATPGKDVVYTIRIENIGDNEVDDGSIFLVDKLPPEVSFLNISFVDKNGNTSPTAVFFQQTANAGLNFEFGRDVGFSSSVSRPANFGECSTEPINGENPTIRFICFNPKGTMAADSVNPYFSLRFRARIR